MASQPTSTQHTRIINKNPPPLYPIFGYQPSQNSQLSTKCLHQITLNRGNLGFATLIAAHAGLVEKPWWLRVHTTEYSWEGFGRTVQGMVHDLLCYCIPSPRPKPRSFPNNESTLTEETCQDWKKFYPQTWYTEGQGGASCLIEGKSLHHILWYG